MTLLEAVVATVLLALVAVACLDGTGQAARLQQQSVQTTQSVALAEAALETARLAIAPSPPTRVWRQPYGPTAREATDALDRLTVEVMDTEGRPVRLTRLVPRPPLAPGERPPSAVGPRP